MNELTSIESFFDKVHQLNEMIVQLCNELGVGYIEHPNIDASRLSDGGLHISYEHTHLFCKDFIDFFNYLIENNFCLV